MKLEDKSTFLSSMKFGMTIKVYDKNSSSSKNEMKTLFFQISKAKNYVVQLPIVQDEG